MHDLSILEMRKSRKIAMKGLCQSHPARKGKAGLIQFPDS